MRNILMVIGIFALLSGQFISIKTPLPEDDICLNESDIDILSGIINAECGVCPEFEKYLVGSVVLNRVHDEDLRWPLTIKGVVSQKGQFTGVSSSNYKDKQSCRKIAQDLLQGIGRVPGIYYFCQGKLCDVDPVIIQGTFHKFGK